MATFSFSDTGESSLDPFLERTGRRDVVHASALGGDFRFESDSPELLQLARLAYEGLPAHRLSVSPPAFHVELRLLERRVDAPADEPPPVRAQSGAGLLCGVMDECNYVVMSPQEGRALVVASRDMLARPYHLRYELIEFAVFTMATRRLGLVPLHGACVGRHGRGLLLLGASGAGKSTLALHSLLGGLDFLAEDAVFVEPTSLLATGVANFLHVKADALGFIGDEAVRSWIREAPVIRRRSGVEKHEADLRHAPVPSSGGPLELVGAVFVSGQRAADADPLLRRMPTDATASRLVADQPYASGQPGWAPFQQRMVERGVYELRRGSHPKASVDALLGLLA
ncbi:serine kinase [Dyella jiangningensis]|uniref:Serine kinase n=1 Tax=Dyella jiangningensis TaxID=1379159 RepID=A0A328P7K3_9GAMM|nr:serine kinase [Dyella jiangningensis]RAO77630.1 serine kinase [Dyella jiangningensis]